jgi:hypothetical protein
MTEKPRPCDPALAAIRALSLVGRSEPYVLGTGDYRSTASADLPFTRNRIGYGSDCWGFAGAWCYKLPRHRPGYNKGPWATVADDLNCDSAIEQAEHAAAGDRVWEVIERPEVGCLLVMPSIRDKEGHRIRIGHVWITTEVPAEWDAEKPQYDLLTTVQCQASSHPAIKKGPGPRYTGTTFRGLTDPAFRIRILRAVGAK